MCRVAQQDPGITHAPHLQGLVLKRELSWQRVAVPEAVVREGDFVRCLITYVDTAKSRIGLSIKVRGVQTHAEERADDQVCWQGLRAALACASRHAGFRV